MKATLVKPYHTTIATILFGKKGVCLSFKLFIKSLSFYLFCAILTTSVGLLLALYALYVKHTNCMINSCRLHRKEEVKSFYEINNLK